MISLEFHKTHENESRISTIHLQGDENELESLEAGSMVGCQKVRKREKERRSESESLCEPTILVHNYILNMANDLQKKISPWEQLFGGRGNDINVWNTTTHLYLIQDKKFTRLHGRKVRKNDKTGAKKHKIQLHVAHFYYILTTVATTLVQK